MRVLSVSLLVGWSVSTLCVAGPPAPNRDRPVNYVEWLNRGFLKRVKDNAAREYDAAAKALRSEEGARVLYDQRGAGSWSSKDKDWLANLLKRNESALRQFAAAARREDCYFKLESNSGAMAAVAFPSLAKLRDVARLVALRAWLRMEEGDLDGALDDAETLLRCQHHLMEQPILIHYLVGLGIGVMGYDVLLNAAWTTAGRFDAEALLARLDRVDRRPRTPRRQFTTEKLSAFDVAQRHLHDGDGDGLFDQLGLPDEIENEAFPLIPAKSFDTIIAETKDFYAKLAKLCDDDYQPVARLTKEIEAEIEQNKTTLIGFTAPSLPRVALLHRRARTMHNGVRTALLLREYHAKHGRWPEQLGHAVVGKWKDHATDPFSGKPFGYRLRDGIPLLYSVSDNGRDEGGKSFQPDGGAKWGETGDYAFWPPQHK